MKVVILCICSLAIGFAVGRNRSISLPLHAATNTQANSKTVSSRKTTASFESVAEFTARYHESKSGPARSAYIRLHQLADSIPLEQAAEILVTARKLMSEADFSSFRSDLLNRWASVDPAGMVAYAESLANAEGREFVLAPAIAEWAYVAPTETMNYLEALPIGPRRCDLFATALAGIAVSDPERAARLLTNVSISQCYQVKSEMLSAIAANDPKAAIDFIERHKADPNFGADDRLFDAPLNSWISKDPQAAIAWLASQSVGFRKRHMEEALRGFEVSAEADPATAARLLTTLPFKADITNPYTSVMSAWCQRDPDECKAWLDQQPDSPQKSNGLAEYASRLSETDPAAAVALIASVTNISNLHRVTSTFSALAEIDPKSALEYCAKLRGSEIGVAAYTGALSGWSANAPREAANYVLDLSTDESLFYAFDEVAANYLMTDPTGAIEWLQTLPEDSRVRNVSLQSVIGEISNHTPELAAKFAALLPGDNDSLDFKILGERWARVDPEEALVWAATLPDPQSRAFTLAGAMSVWAQSAPIEAANYLQHLTGFELEESTRAVVKTMFNDDPLTTARWVQAFPEPLLEKVISEFVPDWINLDIAAATVWINSLPPGPGREMAFNHLPVQNEQ
jgi:hypothetical protein